MSHTGSAAAIRWRPQHLLVIGATWWGVVMRFVQLDTIPSQAWVDEVWVAAKGYQFLHTGQLTAFFVERTHPGNALPIMLTALAQGLGVHSLIVSRLLVAALCIFIVPFAYVCFREMLYPEYGQRAWLYAAVGALIMSFLASPVVLSRDGMEPGYGQPLLLLLIWQLYRGVQRNSTAGWLIAGGVAGVVGYLGAHGYATLTTAAVFGVYNLAAQNGLRRRILRGSLISLVVASIMWVPLILRFADQPRLLFYRAGYAVQTPGSSSAVSIPNGIVKTMAAFNLAGDSAVRHNVPGQPMLDPILSIGFLVGIGLAVAGLGRSHVRRFLILWLIVHMLASILTVGPPNFNRSIGLAPAAVVVSVLGWAAIGQQAGRLFKIERHSLVIVGCAVFGISLIWNTYLIFVRWPLSPDMAEEFTTEPALLLQDIRQRATQEQVYVERVAQGLDLMPLDYGFAGTAARRIDFLTCLPLADRSPARTTYVVNSDLDGQTSAILTNRYRDAVLTHDRLNLWDTGAISVIEVPAGAGLRQPDLTPEAAFGDGLTLYELDMDQVTGHAGTALNLTLYWEAAAPVGHDLTSFIHLYPSGVTDQAPTAQRDFRPCADSYPVMGWRPGDMVAVFTQIPLPANMPAGPYDIAVGWYETGNETIRIPLKDADFPLSDGRAAVGSIVIAP